MYEYLCVRAIRFIIQEHDDTHSNETYPLLAKAHTHISSHKTTNTIFRVVAVCSQIELFIWVTTPTPPINERARSMLELAYTFNT